MVAPLNGISHGRHFALPSEGGHTEMIFGLKYVPSIVENCGLSFKIE
jgi:hypothetical protein